MIETYNKALKERDEALAELRGKAEALKNVATDLLSTEMRTKVNQGDDNKTHVITYGHHNMMVTAHDWLNFDDLGRLLNKYHRAKHAAQQAWDAIPDDMKNLRRP